MTGDERTTASTSSAAAFYGRFEFLTNILIVVVCLMIAFVLVRRHSGPIARVHAESLTGKTLVVQDVRWERSAHSIVLFLQEGCHFCSDSAGFYQRLLKERADQPGVQLVAVFPNNLSSAKEYLKQLGLPIPTVGRANFATVGVQGTPTLAWVDQEGRVVKAWTGKLSTDVEEQVLSATKSPEGRGSS